MESRGCILPNNLVSLSRLEDPGNQQIDAIIGPAKSIESPNDPRSFSSYR